jgi:hypothetical protein
MSQDIEKPLFSWDQPEGENVQEVDDFLSEVEAKDVPLACSIDNPDCEACQ